MMIVSTVLTHSARTGVDVQDRHASLPARRCSSQVATEREQPVSGMWLAVRVGESVATGEVWQNTAKRFAVREPSCPGQRRYRYISRAPTSPDQPWHRRRTAQTQVGGSHADLLYPTELQSLMSLTEACSTSSSWKRLADNLGLTTKTYRRWMGGKSRQHARRRRTGAATFHAFQSV